MLKIPAPALTSGNVLMPVASEVFACEACTHAMSTGLPDASRFYGSEYRISLQSEDHDQLYRVEDGRPVYRSDVQAAAVLDLVEIAPGAVVLDFGCAKAATLRRIVSRRADIRPRVFDVSDDYRAFWTDWIASGDAATFKIPSIWDATVDVVTAHYVFEHIQDIDAAIASLRRLLKPGGTLFLSVPDWTQNWGDLLVVDHVNHFTVASLTWFLRRAGFDHVEIRPGVLPAALVAVARNGTDAATDGNDAENEEKATAPRIYDIGDFWLRCGRMLEDKARRYAGKRVAIYGAGFYGAWIASRIKTMVDIVGFVDANPHLWGTDLFGIPVTAPDAAAASNAMFVGLNPVHARTTAKTIPILEAHEHLVFFDAEGGR